MTITQVSLAQIGPEKSRERFQCWPGDEVRRGAVNRPRTEFETILAVCGRIEDPEFHDGWTPVRARHDTEQG